MLLTFWLATHMSSLRADLIGPYGTSPTTFDVDANGLLSVTGTLGTGSLSLSGGGTRMFWYPGKAAFRAGQITLEDIQGGTTTTQWNDSNIGTYSVAFGLDSQASGIGSSASGAYGLASGSYSAVHNYVTVASGFASSASGFYTTASGYASASDGYCTTATAYESFVIGRFNTGGGTSGSWVSTDPLFEVGDGTYGTHSDALLLKKNGNMTVQGNITAPAFITTGTSGSDIPMFGS